MKYLHIPSADERLILLKKHCANSIAARSIAMAELTYNIETEEEVDGRWIAEIVKLPGVMAYGKTRDEAIANVEALALRVIADQIEERKAATSGVSFAGA